MSSMVVTCGADGICQFFFFFFFFFLNLCMGPNEIGAF
jgi:hypothetical protein